MKWYLNLKISSKLILSFLIVSLISGSVGIYAIFNLKELDESDRELYENTTVPLSIIGGISTEFQRTRAIARDMIIAENPDDIQASIDEIKEIREKVDQMTKEFEAGIISPEIISAFNEYKITRVKFKDGLDEIIKLAQQNRDAEAVAMMSATGESGIASKAYQDAIDRIVALQVDAAGEKAALNGQQADKAVFVMSAVIGLVALFSIVIGFLISNIITRPLRKTVHMIEEMGMGHFGDRLNLKTKDEIGQMARSMDSFADEIQTKVIGVMNMISAGDISVSIESKDDRDEISPALKKTVNTIGDLNLEVQRLIHAATEGKLDIRGDSSNYSGAWMDMITGINGLIDAFVSPINLTAEYIERISKGDIPPVITEVYLGDFNEIKNNINNCITVMDDLLKETTVLIDAAKAGKLDIRGNDSDFNGDWGLMVRGMNELIDAFVAPINVTAEYVERISKGDIPPKITDIYYGDFNETKNNLNQCIDAMGGLLSETGKLIRAAEEGRLDIRSDASEFEGEWKTLIEGVNSLVDAYAKPIHITSEYINRISKGDIPNKITEQYQGDFNVIIANLNRCIDIMNGLLRETNTLINAAKQGILDQRADLKGFSGSWEELLGGVNQLVEAVVEPLAEVTVVMDRIAQGDLQVSVKGNYQGEFGVLSSAVNNTVRDLNTVIRQISETIGEISEGNLTVGNIKGFKGDFVSISDSLNRILDSLNSVLGDINTASDQVSAGSKQVSGGSQALSQGASEQASAVQELTAYVGEVASKTKENAVSAGEANELTLTVKGNAERGNQLMKEMLQAMNEINQASGNISKIIKVIDDIAFQTNILALNAAVEAARAGQHGKGFAVVAEEVRTLASRSAEAARNTTELIQGSIDKAAVGTNIASNTAQALNEIRTGITKIVDIIGNIASSSTDQATGITQINTSLNQVSKVVQTNAATAEQSAASSQELSGQSEMLKEMVARFRLKKEKDTSAGTQMLTGIIDCGSIDDEASAYISVDKNDKY